MNPDRDRSASALMSAVQAYRDGDLPRDQAEAIASRLMQDPGARSVYESSRQLDEAALAALCDPAPPARLRLSHRALAGAGLLIALAATLLVLAASNTPVSPGPRHVVASGARPASASLSHYEPIRVVLEIPVATGAHARSEVTVTRAPVPHESPRAAPSLAWTADSAAQLLQSAAPDQRADACRSLGRLFQSTSLVQDLVRNLDSDARLDVCAAMVRQNQQLALAFPLMQELSLSQDPAVGRRLVALVGEFEGQPHLRSWLRSYPISLRTLEDPGGG